MADMTPDEAKALLEKVPEMRVIAEKATPGPWKWHDGPRCPILVGDHGDMPYILDVWRGILRTRSGGDGLEIMVKLRSDDPDPTFIATFDPHTVLSLLSLVEMQAERIEKVEAERERYRGLLHAVEANADPAGTMRENFVLRENARALESMVERQATLIEKAKAMLRGGLPPGDEAAVLEVLGGGE